MDIYARISHDKKTGTDLEGLNVREQVNSCREWILSRGDEVGNVYTDDSISATSGVRRPAFEQMLVEEPRPVVYVKQSRLERDPGDLDRFLLTTREGYGVDGTRATMESASAELMARMSSLFNRYEQQNKAEFQRAANLRLAKAGKYRGSIRPFGQTRTGEWVEGEAQAVRQAAEALIAGRATFHKVATVWNDWGLLTPKTGRQGGREWTAGTVVRFFKRPRLYGKQEYRGQLYKLRDWEALLSEEEFNAIQALIAERATGRRGESTSRRDTHLLTSILKCECGRGMNVGYRGRKGSGRIYRCPTTNHQSVTAVPVEEYVSLQALEYLIWHDYFESRKSDSNIQLAELNWQRAELVAAHNQWLLEAGQAGTSPMAIRAREDAHAEALAKLDGELFAIQQKAGLDIFPRPEHELSGDYLAVWNTVSLDRRRYLLKSLFTAIYIKRGQQGRRFDTNRVSFETTPLAKSIVDEREEVLRQYPGVQYPGHIEIFKNNKTPEQK